jgi:hypothetical protein
MQQQLFVAALFIGILHTSAGAGGAPTIPFVDGRWNGSIEISPESSGLKECRARTTFGDGTVLTLAKRSDGVWHLRLSNSRWRLPHSHRYAMVAMVDFYPQLRFAAEARSQTVLEIAHIDRISLLRDIENGHTIDLTSDGFHAKYDLEGSAKIIQKIRDCFTG